MPDLIFVAVTLLFFGICLGYLVFCERLGRPAVAPGERSGVARNSGDFGQE